MDASCAEAKIVTWRELNQSTTVSQTIFVNPAIRFLVHLSQLDINF